MGKSLSIKKSYNNSDSNSNIIIATENLIREYWNQNIHDIEITKRPLGTKEFFEEIASYHYEKLEYLPRVVDFSVYTGKKLLEVGCGTGIDLLRFAQGGAVVTGIDLAEVAVDLARKNFELNSIKGEILQMNGEKLQFKNNSFDVAFAHGVLAYTIDAQRMIHEIHRVLKPGGEAILMMYNRNSWLFYAVRLFGISLERDNAPAFNTYSRHEFSKMLSDFAHVEILTERFPRSTRLHRGVKAIIFNTLFVPAFNLIPRSFVRPFGAHLIAKAIK